MRDDALAMQVVRIEPGGRRDAGAVRIGALADLIVVSEDPRSIPADALSEITVLATVNAGRVTYRRAR